MDTGHLQHMINEARDKLTIEQALQLLIQIVTIRASIKPIF